MNQKRVLSVQDISCVGQCSMTVTMPVLSASAVETCILPTALLSTHTGGFGKVYFKDLSESIQPIADHWKRESIDFDCIHVGYLGANVQVDELARELPKLLAPAGMLAIDPVMGDHGRLYTGFDMSYVSAIRELCARGDMILPNITEACFLTGTPYREDYDSSWISDLLEKLSDLGANTVLLTGVSPKPGKTGVVGRACGEYFEYYHEKLPGSCHGTGDLFAAAFIGACMRGVDRISAVKLSADFTCEAISLTKAAPAHWYGIRFEPLLGDWIQKLDASTR